MVLFLTPKCCQANGVVAWLPRKQDDANGFPGWKEQCVYVAPGKWGLGKHNQPHALWKEKELPVGGWTILTVLTHKY